MYYVVEKGHGKDERTGGEGVTVVYRQKIKFSLRLRKEK